MARGASSTGKGVRRAAPDRQARVGVQEWVCCGAARGRFCLFLFFLNFAMWFSWFCFVGCNLK